MTLTQARCCRLLGVSATATADETRAAYRRLARRMHPDRVGGDGERFKEITAAYNWLIARQTGRIIDPPRKTKTRRRRAPTSRGHYRHRPEGGEGDDDAERRSHSDEAADFWKTWQRRRAEFDRDRAGRTEPPRREQQRARTEQGEQGEETEQTGGAERTEQAEGAGHAGRTERDDREARRRARAARRKAWESERAEAESPWDEEFAEAWASWCKTAERFHSAQARRRAGDAAAPTGRADADESRESPEPEAKPWRPTRSDPPAAKPSLFRRVKSRVAELRRKTALDRVGEDISLRLPVDLDLLLHGGTRNIAVNRAAACPSCLGRDAACATCDGAGRIKLRETLRINVPRGARPGARLRLEGKGGAGLDGAPDGDLYLLLEPDEIRGFTRDDLDLRGKVTVSARLARGGGKIDVALPRGSVKLAVPANTRPGDTFRLRGQGLPAWRGGEVGDLFLTVAIR